MVIRAVGGVQKRCSFNHDVPPCVALAASRVIVFCEDSGWQTREGSRCRCRDVGVGTICAVIDSQFLARQYFPDGNEIVSILRAHVGLNRMIEASIETDNVRAVVWYVHYSIGREEKCSE